VLEERWLTATQGKKTSVADLENRGMQPDRCGRGETERPDGRYYYTGLGRKVCLFRGTAKNSLGVTRAPEQKDWGGQSLGIRSAKHRKWEITREKGIASEQLEGALFKKQENDIPRVEGKRVPGLPGGRNSSKRRAKRKEGADLALC